MQQRTGLSTQLCLALTLLKNTSIDLWMPFRKFDSSFMLSWEVLLPSDVFAALDNSPVLKAKNRSGVNYGDVLKAEGIFVTEYLRETFIYHYNGDSPSCTPLCPETCAKLPAAQQLRELLAERRTKPLSPKSVSWDESVLAKLGSSATVLEGEAECTAFLKKIDTTAPEALNDIVSTPVVIDAVSRVAMKELGSAAGSIGVFDEDPLSEKQTMGGFSLSKTFADCKMKLPWLTRFFR